MSLARPESYSTVGGLYGSDLVLTFLGGQTRHRLVSPLGLSANGYFPIFSPVFSRSFLTFLRVSVFGKEEIIHFFVCVDRRWLAESRIVYVLWRRSQSSLSWTFSVF